MVLHQRTAYCHIVIFWTKADRAAYLNAFVHSAWQFTLAAHTA